MNSKTVTIVVAVILLVTLGGCSLLSRDDLFASGRYRLEVDSIEDCTLRAISYEQDGRLIVEGRMTRRHHRNAPLSGDVQAQVFGPQGDLLQTKSVPFEPLPHSRHSHPAARSRFIFEQIPPAGSVIKLTHTLRPFDGAVDEPVIR